MNSTSFCCAGAKERKEMMATLGLSSFDGLYKDIPDDLISSPLNLPEGLSELEMLQKISKLEKNHTCDLINFCGAGFYDHFIPAAIDAITSRGEFLTAYTPYQPEAAQGSLQSIFEYQTAITRLTDMDVSNASLYDGGTAMFEAILLALRQTRKNRIIIDEGVNPIYRAMIKSYAGNLKIDCEEIPMSGGLADRQVIKQALNSNTAAVVLQNPNFFGCTDDLSDIIENAHAVKALAIVSVYPLSLGLLKTPGEMGADIVTGEGQSLGMPLLFGGPYLGFMAVRKKLARKMPGRVAGMTEDQNGKRGFVLTLQTREQHIRREKATSNICTNQAHCALRAIIYLSLLGKDGLVEVAELCAANAACAFELLTAIPGVEPAFKQPFFNEFAISLPTNANGVVSALLDQGVAAGFPPSRYYKDMENILLLAFTEKRTKEEINVLAAKIETALV